MVRVLRQLCIVGSLISMGLLATSLLADGPADNASDSVRSVPPAGIEIPREDRQALEEGHAKLLEKLNGLRLGSSTFARPFLPDVEVFEKALRLALTEDGFFSSNDIKHAHKVLELGMARVDALLAHKVPADLIFSPLEEMQTVRGFRSALDGSVQPYGVYYKPSLSTPSTHKPSLLRGDVWCRGRSEKGLEIQFLAQHLHGSDMRPVPGVLMIYPFGRYCNANKLAGEVDTLEAIQNAMASYPLDPDGISIRGFSMGGAAAWHLAVHYPDRWFAATPGAGFSETPQFLDVFQNEKLQPRDFEASLWKLYDCPFWVNNLRNVPTIAYSGELDKQKQAADVMAAASWDQPAEDRFELTHLIGPKTAHRIEASAGEEIERRLQKVYEARDGRTPSHVDFTTYTLKYNRCHWLTIDAMQEHWKKARVRANIDHENVYVTCEGVSAFSLKLDLDEIPAEINSLVVHVKSNGNGSNENFPAALQINRRSDRSFQATFAADPNRQSVWETVSPVLGLASKHRLAKKNGLQGPIDDAFMGPFLFVKPTTNGHHSEIDEWVQRELDRAVREWHRQMRGDVRVISPDELVEADFANNNIVLWGDPKSNSMIADALALLPLEWTNSALQMGGENVDSAHHVPILIYPNPRNPDKYVVLNTGLTYREYDYLNNARQVPKLPDWAIVDVREQSGPRWPGKVMEAGFFDEKWQWK